MIDGQLYQSEGSSVTPITASIEDNILVIRLINEDQCNANNGLGINESNAVVNTDVINGESAEPLRFQQSEVNAKSKLGNLPREITLPNDRLLVCSNGDKKALVNRECFISPTFTLRYFCTGYAMGSR